MKSWISFRFLIRLFPKKDSLFAKSERKLSTSKNNFKVYFFMRCILESNSRSNRTSTLSATSATAATSTAKNPNPVSNSNPQINSATKSAEPIHNINLSSLANSRVSKSNQKIVSF